MLTGSARDSFAEVASAFQGQIVAGASLLLFTVS